jgi:hypothetical protein
MEHSAPGTYQVVIQDENGCFCGTCNNHWTTHFYGTYDPSLIIPEVCAGDKDAFHNWSGWRNSTHKVSLDANGTYTQGAVGQTTFDFTNLTGGTHTVYIQDASNCAAELEVIMPDPVVINPERIITYDFCVNNAQAK